MKANKTQRKTGYQHAPQPTLAPAETSNHDLTTQIVSPDDDLMPAPPNPTANVTPHPNWVSLGGAGMDADEGGM